MDNSVVSSNEMEANQPANPESGEGHNQPEETRTEHVISSSDSFQGRLRTLMDSDASVKEEAKGHKPLIGQIPMLLGMEIELKKYFQPRIMSIGPLHSDKNELEQGQQYKRQLAKRFINDNMSQSAEILFNNILNKIASFKECYDKQELNKFNKDDQELAWMFFVDGCALIDFVEWYDNFFGWFAFYDMNIPDYQIEHVVTDLMLVDNQLPLGVLNLVMEFSKRGESLRMSINRFAEEIIEMIHFEGRAKDEKADHSTTDQSLNEENHLLELIWMKLVKKEKDDRPDTTRATSRNFRSVKELQAAGITLEPNNSSISLRDISFNRGIFFHKLKIPGFRVSEQGKFLLFNLIAFEMHPNFRKDHVVTSCISFLNSLITTKEDVAELQKVGILFNSLLNDEEVVKTFQELTSSLKPYPDIFCDTKKDLINYFNNKRSMTIGKWLSEAMHVYFRSPWTTIAVFSATFLLILTIIQAIFSVLAFQHR